MSKLRLVIGKNAADCHVFVGDQELTRISSLTLAMSVLPGKQTTANVVASVIDPQMTFKDVPCTLTIESVPSPASDADSGAVEHP